MRRFLISTMLLLITGMAHAQSKYDLNDDKAVTKADVEVLAKVVVGDTVPSLTYDLNGDGKVSVADVTLLVNAVFGRVPLFPETLDAPTEVNARLFNNTIRVSWKGVSGATSYQLYRSADDTEYTLLASDFTTTSYTDPSPLIGRNYYRVKAIAEGIESPLSDSTSPVAYDDQNGLLTGLYVGVIGFNRNLYDKGDMSLLAPNTKSSFTSFVDGLSFMDGSTTLTGTVMYWGIDNALEKLTTTTYPNNLTNVSIVTFTDGLDQGSPAKSRWKYFDPDEYREALASQIRQLQIQGYNVDSYTIGLRGGDVPDVSYPDFKANLTELANSADNTKDVADMAIEVSDMTALDAEFQQIARNLTEVTQLQSLSVKFPIIGRETIMRFTFDDVSDAADSQCYIEGTLNGMTYTMSDISYVGLTCDSGTSLEGEYDGDIMVEFTFENVKMADGSKVSLDHLSEYYWRRTYWQVNSEFNNADDVQVGVSHTSAAIMLALDCSSSLGVILEGSGDTETMFVQMKAAAKRFIETLAGAMEPVYMVSGVTLNKSSVTINPGSTSQLTASTTPSNATNGAVSWTSSDTSVATVNSEGLVTAVSGGTCTITATAKDGSGVSSTCTVSVPYWVTDITLSSSELSINAGAAGQLAATISPSNATNKAVTWSSSDTNVATVNSSGVVTGVSRGSCTITATAKDGSGVSGSSAVTVNQLVTGITLNYSTKTIVVGTTAQLAATASPSNANNTSVTWSSSNTSVATVSSNGLVTGVANGTCTITATANDGSGKSASCTVTITTLVTGITLSSSTLTVNAGATSQLTATISPTNASNKAVTWSSSNTSVATVNSSGVVTGVSRGSCTITATAQDGSGKTASCAVTVNQLVTGITLNCSTQYVEVGNTAQLIATTSPTNANNSAITWTSSNTNVAIVNNEGLVTGISNGSCVITLVAQDGSGKTATCIVKVFIDNSGTIGGRDYVDLGLPSGTLWAACNVGANSPEQYGILYAWGETSTKSSYYESDYTYVDDGFLSKYCTDRAYGWIVDNKTVLDLSDDAAYSNWGANWRMPSYSQLAELIDGSLTTTIWTTQNGINGRLITSKQNGKSIFLPAAGGRRNDSLFGVGSGGYYWSRTLSTYTSWYASYLSFESSNIATDKYIRYYGCSVRPVRSSSLQLVTDITLSSTSLTISPSSTSQLSATIFPVNATNSALNWTSSDAGVAMVDSEGLVTGVSAGACTITATARDGSGKSASCAVTVTTSVLSLTLSSSMLNISAGSTALLTAIVFPSNAANKSITWSSSNTNVATVDSEGLVTGVSNGTCTITATAQDGSGKSASCTVIVPKLVSDITLDNSSLLTFTGHSCQLMATVSPTDATNSAVTWTSSNTSVATVSTSGLVRGITAGSCTITATAKDGSGVSASCIVTVSTDNSGSIGGHAYVDLALPSGTLWATCNIGASSPESYGNYYAWGETTTKSTYDWSTYKYCSGLSTTMKKYCTESSYGTVDNKTELEISDDVAYANWGSDWRMPTDTQLSELINSEYTTTTWITQNSVYGRRITSKLNGNSIFLPAAGYRSVNSLLYASSGRYGGFYWSRMLVTNGSSYAYILYFGSSDVGTSYDYRCKALSVRPVRLSQ